MTHRSSPAARPAVAVLGALVLAGAAACSSGAGHRPAAQPSIRTTTSTASATPTPARPRPAVPAYYRQRLAWADCGNGFQCATLTVPLDYRQPTGETIHIAVTRLPASDPAERIGSLLLNPGGPGASGVSYARYARYVFPSSVRARFDIVGFDPRGVGASTAVHCLSGPQLDQEIHLDPDPPTQRGVALLVQEGKFWAQRCQARSGALLAHVSTLDQARDMDVLRAALGDRRLTYIGWSYGTYLGAKYAQLFPTHIRALVLDGALDPSTTTLEQDAVQAVGFERDLNDFLTYCANSGSCPLGSTASSAEQGLVSLTDRVRQQPLPGGSGRTLGPGELFLGVAFGMYDPAQGWPALVQALAAAESGDGAPMLRLTDALTGRNPDGTFNNEQDALTAISCVDRPSPTSLAAYEQAAAATARRAPYFGAGVVYGSLPCMFWPTPPVESPHPVTAAGSPPILVVGTTGDPATPYVWAQRLARQLSRGWLLTYQGDGHTAYGRGDSCIDSAVDSYLISLTLPPAGTVCR